MIPSAAPYSVSWNAERQVTTRKPAHLSGLFFAFDLAFLRIAAVHCLLALNCAGAS